MNRNSALKKKKWLATGLLAVVTLVYFVSRYLEKRFSWHGFISAFSEAAMVGAIADWFAVTAIFRHPLGVPRGLAMRIPLLRHTAVIPENKERIGKSLGNFVEKNFLSPEVIIERLKSEDVAGQAARWLSAPHNTEFIADELCAFVPKMLGAIDDEDVRRFVRENLTAAAQRMELSAGAGDLLEILTSKNKHHALFDEGIKYAKELFDEYKPALQKKISDGSGFVVKLFDGDVLLYNKFVTAVEKTIREAAIDPEHSLRKRFDEAISRLIKNLKEDPGYQTKGEEIKEEILSHPTVQRYLESVWSDWKALMLEDAKAPDSVIKARLKEALGAIGAGLLRDSAAKEKINLWIQEFAVTTVSRNRHAISGLIAEKVNKWDAKTITNTLEAEIGEDLQYIRINGTIVGGLVGLLIYTLSLLL